MIIIFLSLWLVPEFIIKNWYIPFSLSMIVYIKYLKLSGGYKGLSTGIAIFVTTIGLVVNWWLYPAEIVGDGIYGLVFWIITPLVVWWDRAKL